MKRVLTIISYWMSALALVGMVACNKVPDNVSPDYDPDSNTVKAQFVLSVSTEGASTKMTAETVQRDGNPFRGMANAHLYTFTIDDKFKGAQGGYYIFNPDADATLKPTRDFNLGTLVAAKEITADNHKRVVQLAVPLDMNSVMIYGKAPKTGTALDAEVGAVEMTLPTASTSLNSASFQLKNRLKDEAAFKGMGILLGTSMTILADAGLVNQTTFGRDTHYAFWWPIDDTSKNTDEYPLNGNNGDKKNSYTFYKGTKTWRELGVAYDKKDKQVPLEEVMGRAYSQLTTISTREGDSSVQELRAGSTSAVLYMLRHLAELIDRTIGAVPTSPEDEIARLLAVEVKTRMGYFFEGTGGSIYFKSMQEILTVAQNFPNATVINEYSGSLTATSNGDFFPDKDNLSGGFPLNLGLPLSAALMTCALNADNKMEFKYLDGVPAYGMGSGSLPITNYRYPAELMYWGNSSIRISDLAQDKVTFPKGIAAWAEDENWTGGWEKNGIVNSTTRTIAMMQQVSYGNALLRSTVKVAAKVHDNRKARTGEADQVIDVENSIEAFKVTGIFVGGVADVVGWDFTRKNNNLPAGITSNNFDKMIYDEVDPTGEHPYYANTKSGDNPIYTLVWDNYHPSMNTQTGQYLGPGTQKDQTDVYVAVEFLNNTGLDLWGELNMIPNQSTFYLVGKIDLQAAVAANNALDDDAEGKVVFPSSKLFHYPPFDGDGNTIQVLRAFMQDYVTKVNFRFEPDALTRAYMTVPDLRANQISLGLSVDVEWKSGLTFEVELGKID